MIKIHISSAVLAALGAAILFGASTPFAKQLLGDISPLLLAGLLYLGSGVGLTLTWLLKNRGWVSPGLLKIEWIYLAFAILFGGIVGPILLMLGLMQTSAATASLLLNLEAVLTAVLAWFVFKENTNRRIIIGMVLIVAGSIALSWSDQLTLKDCLGSLAVAGACLCWAVDNNLTRKIAATDALFIASTKGFIAGLVNISLGVLLGFTMPIKPEIGYALLIGFLGYGVSLVLFIIALRGLGTARTGAYFSMAPFVGATIAILFFHEATSLLFWFAVIMMGMGMWIHLTESHEHNHTHEMLYHHHFHKHDEHHQHTHDFLWDGTEPHQHFHQHDAITHSHHHYPDIHHRHKHE